VGWVKVNNDALVDKKKGWLGYGVVVRDARGVVIATQSKTIKGNLDATLVEAGVMLMAIHLCQRLGFIRCTLKEIHISWLMVLTL
jgi:hypothetical protein